MRLIKRLRCRSLLRKLIISILIVWFVYRLTIYQLDRRSANSSLSLSGAGAWPSPRPGHIYRGRSSARTSADYDDARQNSAHVGIPRIIHQTWKTYDTIPNTFRTWIDSWIQLNPEWDYWFWTDDDIRALIASAYPDYLSLYDSYPTHAYRIDVFRYFVLHRYGGLYVDLDMECLRSMEEFLVIHSKSPTADCFLSQEPEEHALFLAPHGAPLASNALMGCRPRHPFFAHVISGLDWYSTGWGRLVWNDVLRSTGPYMLTLSYREYWTRPGWMPWLLGLSRSSSLVQGHLMPLGLAAAGEFHPTPDDSMVDYMRQVCDNARSAAIFSTAGRWFWQGGGVSSDVSVRIGRACDRLRAYDFGRGRSSTAFSMHHWTHSWVGRRNDPWGLLNKHLKLFSIEELFDDRRRVRQ